ncbi:MAG TPA: SusC/RagA family TonB-linked outer membrane protein [Gemmatimonadaceae bacterium]|nr:SusC/RagA family TonB-linked outer membrane protein [Gemmatimonadaceae bacterium]
MRRVALLVTALTLVVLLCPGRVRAQGGTGRVTGLVTTAATNQPLANAQVSIAGTTKGTLTGANGRFVLAGVAPGTYQVRVALLGYAPQTADSVRVRADSSTTVNFALEVTTVELAQVVVVGYGTKRREEVTSAVTSVTSDEFNAGPARDAASLIAGKIPGMSVNTPSGDPTRSTEIMLRGVTTLEGSTAPLVLIDGVPGNLDAIPTPDIESITVLKDGSAAAIYGSRASNGVILITTKRHGSGPPTLRYDGYVSKQTIYKRPDILSAADYHRLIGEGYDLDDEGYNTDWIGLLTRQPISHRHNLTLAGGSANTNYNTSFNYQNTQGTFIRSNNEVMTGQGRIRHSMFDGRLEAEAMLLNRTQKYFTGPDFDYAFQQALIRNPLDGPKNEDGTWRQTSTGALRYVNPLSLIEEDNGSAENRLQRMHGKLTFTPIDRFQFSLLAGITRDNVTRGDATTFQHPNNTEDNSGGTAQRSSSSSLDRILELTGTFNDRIGDHGFTLLGGYSYQDSEDEAFSAGNSRFPTDLVGDDDLGAGTGLPDGIATMSSRKSAYNTIGFFGRLNYDWKSRYLLMASFRYEANSRFGAGHKWGAFPGVSVGWRIGDEAFMRGVSWVNELKLRAGYGVTGIAPDRSYLSLTGYEYGAPIYSNGSWVPGVSPSRNPNPDLRWEEKDETDIGLDFSLFDFRLSGSVDVYRRETKDMLYEYSVPVPPNLFDEQLANVGRMRNDGMEVSLTYKVIDRPGLSWTTGANWSTNSNKLVSLSNDVYQTADFFYEGGTGAPIQQTTHRVMVGEPIGDFYGFQSVDIDDDGVWIVLNKDGERVSIKDVTEADRRVLGNGIPKHFFAWNNSVRYGKFDLGVNMRGAAGFQILNFLRLYYENPTQLDYNMLASAFDPVYGKRTVNYDLAYVSYYVEDGDYIKLDNATLGYTFSGSEDGMFGVLHNARVYVSGRNLLTLTGYKGLDPEVSFSGLAPGNDNRAQYPTTRMFTLGLSFTLQ